VEIGRAETDWLVTNGKNVHSEVKNTQGGPWVKGKSKFRLILLSQQEAERYRRWVARLARISGDN